MTIPLFKPELEGDEEIEAVTRVLRSGWWAMGPELEKFEEEFAEYTHSRYAVGVNSCTAALELAARAVGLDHGVVVMPALTFVSTFLAMKHAGNQVIFADIDEESLCIDWDQAAQYLKPGGCAWYRKAIVPVWYSGTVVTPGGDRFAQRRDFKVIEDCAHAAGSRWAGRIGDVACWSFQAVKNLATGDGGMITTNDPEVADKARRLRWCGIDKSTWERDTKTGYGWDYNIEEDGEKANMNDIQAALGRVQLKYLDRRNVLRRRIAGTYNEHFKGLPWLKTPPLRNDSATHMYVIRVPAEDRNRFIDHCIANGVSAGVHYKPLTHYTSLHGHMPDPAFLPVTNRVWKTLVTLPLFPSLKAWEQDQVIDTVLSFPI